MKDELASKDRDKTAGLFYQGHDGYFTLRIGICDKKASVGYYKKNGKQPDPMVFKCTFEIKNGCSCFWRSIGSFDLPV